LIRGRLRGHGKRRRWFPQPALILRPTAVDPVTPPLGRLAAFTLLEILIVVAVVALLLALSQQALGAAHRQALRQQARAELAVLDLALEAYRRDVGVVPAGTTGVELWAALGGETAGRRWLDPAAHRLKSPDPGAPGNELLDPWQSPYRYLRIGTSPAFGYVLYSIGPDGRDFAPDAEGRVDFDHPDNRDNVYGAGWGGQP
jgi:general secretion pathway protein G